MCRICANTGLVPVFSFVDTPGGMRSDETMYECECSPNAHYVYKEKETTSETGKSQRIKVKQYWGASFKSKFSELQFPMPQHLDYYVAYQIGKYAILRQFRKDGTIQMQWTNEMQDQLNKMDVVRV